jgi:hypothetical protein
VSLPVDPVAWLASPRRLRAGRDTRNTLSKSLHFLIGLLGRARPRRGESHSQSRESFARGRFQPAQSVNVAARIGRGVDRLQQTRCQNSPLPRIRIAEATRPAPPSTPYRLISTGSLVVNHRRRRPTLIQAGSSPASMREFASGIPRALLLVQHRRGARKQAPVLQTGEQPPVRRRNLKQAIPT